MAVAVAVGGCWAGGWVVVVAVAVGGFPHHARDVLFVRSVRVPPLAIVDCIAHTSHTRPPPFFFFLAMTWLSFFSAGVGRR